MFIDDIKTCAKENDNIIVLFDMDGVLAEFGIGEKDKIINNEKGFFLSKRPIRYNLKQAKKISKIKNVKVGIQSNCHFSSQAEEKREWLRKYAPFVDKEHINIIPLKEIEFEKDQKNALKAKYIKEKYKNGEIVFFIDDDHKIIKDTYLLGGIRVYHMSSLIK